MVKARIFYFSVTQKNNYRSEIYFHFNINIVHFFVNPQTNSFRLKPNIILPKDSFESKNLTTSINAFLLLAKKSNEENKFVFDN